MSTINETEIADISEFDPIRSENKMSICSTVDTSINKTDHPNYLSDSNHKNMTTQRVSRTIATKKASVELIVNDDTTHYKCRLMTENPSKKAEIVPPGSVGSNVPEITHVK